ncbi:hypothetical protein [Actinoplanes aureus]|jgi:hypothetical protein|uniref:Uncharacterized protein n=1 Tax=Actinoplanes aureus TaxID=2792083 RepID=A0A931G189_9ACTN|nr:hypothetical protein [Actinoplanes aureus]MBG0566760.1 hypothetical protein [Actinoplanes aureus]
MAEISITPDHIRRLGIKLMGLQHKLTAEERTILWGALAVAADVLNKSDTEPGQTNLVDQKGIDGALRAKVDPPWRDDPDLNPDFPDMLARAFYPERQKKDARDPLKGEDMAGKIGGDVKIRSAQRGG